MSPTSRRTLLTAAGGALTGAALLSAPASASGGSAVRTVHAFYRALQAKDLDAFAALWTRDAVWRMPITPEGVPGQMVGRDTIVSTLRGFFVLFGEVHFTWRVEPLRDTRRALAHWTLNNELVTGGRYRNQGLALFDVRGGRIAEFEEHFDTAAFLRAFG